MKKYVLTDVWVSEELASALIDRHGCKSDISMKYSSDVLPSSYRWDVLHHKVYRHSNCLTSDEDDLAEILLLIPTIKAKLEYLNNH